MSRQNEVLDCLGNPIDKDNLVIVQAPFPLVFKVLSVEKGGLHTANGTTMTVLRLICDINLRKPPGMMFVEVIRAVQRDQNAILSQIMDGTAPGRA